MDVKVEQKQADMRSVAVDMADQNQAWLARAVEGLAVLPGVSAVLAVAHDQHGAVCGRQAAQWPAGDLASQAAALSECAWQRRRKGELAGVVALDCVGCCLRSGCSRPAEDRRDCLLLSVPTIDDLHHAFLVQREPSGAGLETAREGELLAKIYSALSQTPIESEHFSAVSRAKNEWEAAVDALPQVVCLLDGRGRVLRANRALEQWRLGSVQDCRGRSLHELLHPRCGDDDCSMRSAIAGLYQALDTELVVSIELHDAALGGELRISLGHAELDSDHHDGGLEQASYAIIEDIGEQKRAEHLLQDYNRRLERAVQEKTDDLVNLNRQLLAQVRAHQKGQVALRESEARYEGLVENSVTGIYLSDGERVLYCNRKFAEVFGEERGGIRGQRLSRLFPGRDFERFITELREIDGGYREAEIEGRTEHGRQLMTRQSVSRACIDDQDLYIGNLVDITQQKHMERELRRLASQRIQAQEGERARIASELHDGIGQSISAIKFSMENVLCELPEDGAGLARERLQRTIERARESIEEVRRISMDLRPTTLDHLGLVATIGWFCREFGNLFPATLVVKAVDVEEVRVPEYLKLDIFRIMQEAMNNAAKHADAATVTVSLRERDEQLWMVIGDDGRGFDVEQVLSSSHTFGLRSMRERAECSGGQLHIQSGQAGTQISVHWPFNEGLSG